MQEERNLTRAEARAIARDIVESGLVDEWEAKAAAYNGAVADFRGWLQDLPAFPARLADRWGFYTGALAVAEEITELLRKEAQ